MMKTIRLGLVLVSLLVLQIFICNFLPLTAKSESTPDVYVGVDLAYGSTAEAKTLIDQVSSYTNFIVIGTSKITGNQARLNETCQYAYDHGLSFVLWTPTGIGRANRTAWFSNAKQAWGDHFLGFYALDEPAGRQLDQNDTQFIRSVSNNYVDAAKEFESNLGSQLSATRSYYTANTTNYLPLFTSDYDLYWFDYKAGYDTMFAEFGWNYSKQFNAALCRGAATAQNKNWGAIILYTYTHFPYLESGSDLYKDMVLAYDNGAKYIVIFDSNPDYTGSILQTEHLQAMQQFWQYVQTNPRKSTPTNGRTAFALPGGYGYGFRGPGDKIWGLWPADDLSSNLSRIVSNLLTKYGANLDIIYDDGLQPGNNGYSQLLYWNDTNLIPPATPTSTNTTAPAYAPPPTQTDPSPPSQPPPIENLSSPLDYTVVVVAVAAVVGVAAPVLVVFRKRQHCVTFGVSGVGRDFVGTVVVVDGKDYDRYGGSFWWDHGSRHTFEFKTPLMVNSGKQYVLTSTSGARTLESDALKVSMQMTVAGNYQLVLKTAAHSRLV
jgi:hypothetical protein